MHKVELVNSNGLVTARHPQAEHPSEVEIERCKEWIGLHCKKCSSYGETSSYGLKHYVEYWRKDNGSTGTDYYVSNGAFIVAAIEMGYNVKRDNPGSPNAVFNMSFILPGDEWMHVKPTGFSRWLLSKSGENSPIGDLASDLKSDKRWDRREDDYYKMMTFFEDCGYMDAFIVAFNDAYSQYSDKKSKPIISDVKEVIERNVVEIDVHGQYPRATFGETYIYILFEKRSNYYDRIIRYVGQTIDPVKRLNSHIISPGSFEKTRWIGGVLNDDRSVKMGIIDKVLSEEAMDMERAYSYALSREGYRLLNKDFFYEPCKYMENSRIRIIGRW